MTTHDKLLEIIAPEAQPAQADCTCASKDMPFGRCCKFPALKVTNEWESCRVADYNKGWNDAIEAAQVGFDSWQAATLAEQAQPAQRGAPMFTFRECEDSHAIADAVSTERERRAVLSYKAGMDGLAAAIRSGK